ncbi:MAG: sugar phosphate nucleotidyltransferase [Candidatus Zixiibacteriota bacterium]
MAIVLAAGLGKRMKSDLPKVLHPVDGKPVIRIIGDMLKDTGLAKTVFVVGHGRELVKAELAGEPSFAFVVQEQQRGTGHAVMMAEDSYRDFHGSILVLAGDVPLLRKATLEKLIAHEKASKAAGVVVSFEPPDSAKYGRIVRGNDGKIKAIVEFADCNEVEKAIREVNTGLYVFDAQALVSALKKLESNNAQGELYITDVMRILMTDGHVTDCMKLDDYREGLGFNDPNELKLLESIFFELKH